jgi:hypothetical protein
MACLLFAAVRERERELGKYIPTPPLFSGMRLPAAWVVVS